MRAAKLVVGFMAMAAIIFACKKKDDITSNVLNVDDQNFIVKASINNFSEIQTAKIAVAKTSDSIVLSFAQSMLAEHTQAHSDLKTMGSVVGFAVSDTIDPAHDSVITQLNGLTGRTFDSAYIHNQVAEHDSTVGFYKTELSNGRQLNLTHYANTYLQYFVADSQRVDSIAALY